VPGVFRLFCFAKHRPYRMGILANQSGMNN